MDMVKLKFAVEISSIDKQKDILWIPFERLIMKMDLTGRKMFQRNT